MTVEVSIVVPTRNGAGSLPALLEAIGAQRDPARRELIIVDSGSTDGTLELARAAADHLIAVPRRQFNHGAARNLGIARATGRFIVLTVQDARPVGGDWLTALLAPLRRDSQVAGAFARQQPRPDASAVTRHQLAQWVAARATPHVATLDAHAFERLTPMERLAHCAFDNVCSALRRAVWERSPLPESPIAEDLAWSRDVLLAGHAIAFAPEAIVEHSHERGVWYELARTWVLHQQLHRLFGLRSVPTLRALARSIVATVGTHHRVAGGAPRLGSASWRRAVALGVAWPLGQFLGGWTSAHRHTGWRPRGV